MNSTSAPAGLAICPACKGAGKAAGSKSGYAHYLCAQCGSLFVFPTPETFLETYTTGSYFSGATGGHGYVDYDRDKIPMIGTFQTYLDLMARHGCPSGALLDIGAATGFFLNLARERGFRTFGVEPGPEAVERARSKGLDVFLGTLDTYQPPVAFDAITMLDVLEHVPDPRADIRKVASLLKPGGLLAINTPDQGSLMSKALGLKWHLVAPPEHLCLFTARAVENILREHGFEILVIRRIGKSFTMQYVIQTLANNHKLAVWRSLAGWLHHNPLGRMGIPINLRDNIFVLARKK